DAPGRCYTVDTLMHFNSEWSEKADLFFIMGADSWLEIMTWRDCNRLLSMTNHIVVTRPGYEVTLDHVGDITRNVIDLRKLPAAEIAAAIAGPQKPKIFITDTVMNDISATEIRRAANDSGRDLATLVPAPVAEYIRKYQLYREKHETEFND